MPLPLRAPPPAALQPPHASSPPSSLACAPLCRPRPWHCRRRQPRLQSMARPPVAAAAAAAADERSPQGAASPPAAADQGDANGSHTVAWQERVPAGADGQLVHDVLVALRPGDLPTKTAAKRALRRRAIIVDGAPAERGQALRAGQLLQCVERCRGAVHAPMQPALAAAAASLPSGMLHLEASWAGCGWLGCLLGSAPCPAATPACLLSGCRLPPAALRPRPLACLPACSAPPLACLPAWPASPPHDRRWCTKMSTWRACPSRRACPATRPLGEPWAARPPPPRAAAPHRPACSRSWRTRWRPRRRWGRCAGHATCTGWMSPPGACCSPPSRGRGRSGWAPRLSSGG